MNIPNNESQPSIPEGGELFRQTENGKYALINRITESMRGALIEESEVQNITPEQEVIRTIGGKISLLPYRQYLQVEGYTRELRNLETDQERGNRLGETIEIPAAMGNRGKSISLVFKKMFERGKGVSSALHLLRTCYPQGKDMINPHAENATGLPASGEYRIEDRSNHEAWKDGTEAHQDSFCIHVYPDRDKPNKKIWVECQGERISMQDGDSKIVGRKGAPERRIYGIPMTSADGKMILPFRDIDLQVKPKGCSREAFLIVFSGGKIFMRDRASSRPIVITSVNAQEKEVDKNAWSYNPSARNIDGTYGATEQF